jgi:hypothetical protein
MVTSVTLAATQARRARQAWRAISMAVVIPAFLRGSRDPPEPEPAPDYELW